MKVTSLEAWDMIQPYLSRMHNIVLFLVQTNPDKTYRELAKIGGYPEVATVSRRGGELERKGLIYSTGIKVQNNRRRAHIWRASADPVISFKEDKAIQLKNLDYDDWCKLRKYMEKRGYHYTGYGEWKKIDPSKA